MAGAEERAVWDWSAEFADELRANDLSPGAMAAIARHRAAGDRLILLSASVDLYVPAIGRRLGFDESICTGVAWRNGQLDGALTTPNRRANEKRRCIAALRERFPGARIAAYANALSDLEHLAVADEPRLVNGSPAARRSARRLGIPSEDWCNKPATETVPSA